MPSTSGDAADAFYRACEQSDTALLDALYRPGFERMVNHKPDFEGVAGLRWFLDRGVDVNAEFCLHHAIGRGRSAEVIEVLLDAGADVNLPWGRWDVVAALLDAGMAADTRGWSNFTPLGRRR
ncbi:hypothetical protein ACFXGA_06545 [Actinosynnema sp. NPDC059335]|uniref:hypothetical protein n=1 Tax=Actinosynnema sp. NPDC059335 TaxID=3346804 RepID=UPI00366C196F